MEYFGKLLSYDQLLVAFPSNIIDATCYKHRALESDFTDHFALQKRQQNFTTKESIDVSIDSFMDVYFFPRNPLSILQ